MSIDPKIKQKADDIRNKVYGREVRESLASGLEEMSEDVEDIKGRQESVESQFQTVIDETTGKDVISAPEITAARVGADDTNHPNLKERLDFEHNKLSSQLAQIENKATNIDTNVRFLETSLNERIDNIITTPAEGITQEEIIDARQGEPSLGANISRIRNQIEHRIRNKIINGDFSNGIENWLYGNTDSTITATNGVLTIKANGTSPSARPYQRIPSGMIPNHKIYVKGEFRAKNPDVINMGFALYKSGDPNAEIIKNQIAFPRMNETYALSGIIELPNVEGDLSVSLRIEYFSSEVALNKEVEVQKVIALDLTEIFGAGNEPSVEEIDELLSYHGGWFDGEAKLDEVVKSTIVNRASKEKFNKFSEQVYNRTFDLIDTLPVNRHKYDSNVSELFRFITHYDAYNVDGASTDSDILFEGKPTVSLRSNGNGAFAAFTLDTVRNLANEDYIDFYVCVDNINNLDALQIDLANSPTNLTIRYSHYYLKDEITKVMESGWRYIRIPKRKFVVASGTPDWSQIRSVRVFARAKSGASVKVNVGKIDTVRVKKGAIHFYFDDATISQYENGFRIMDKYGLKGTIAVPTAKVGVNPDYVTWAQLREMDQAGWLVVSHTHTERNLGTLTESELRYEFETSSRILFDHGFHFGSKCLVAPQGSWGALADKVSRDYFALCRTRVYNSTERAALPSSEHMQSHPRYKKYVSPYNYDSPELLKSWIDNVITHKEELSIAWHIIETPAPNQWSTPVEVFEEVIAYARQKVDEGVLDVVTWLDTMPQVQKMNPIDDVGEQYLISSNGKPTVLTLPINK